MKKYIALLLVLATVVMTGCTSVVVNVKPVPAGSSIKSVSIVENPKVAVTDFTDVLISGFARHGIAARLVKTEVEAKSEYIVFYVATRRWDLKPYLVDASIRIEHGGIPIATAEYNGSVGLDLSKFDSTKSKMDPVIDELLKDIK